MTDSDPASFLIILTLILLLTAVVASKRHKTEKVAIFVISLFLGWSLIGWVVALAWASKGISDYNYR